MFRDLQKKTEKNIEDINCKKSIESYIKYKFKKAILEQHLTRIQMIHNLGIS